MLRRVIRHAVAIGATVLAGGFFGATLVRLAPGFGVDEQEMDTRLRDESVLALRQSREQEQNVVRYYGRYLAGLLKGDLGVSRSLHRPVAELFAQRIPVTFRSVGAGLLAGWSLGLALALPAGIGRRPEYELFSTFLTGGLLSIPSALLALCLLFLGGAASCAIALVVLPRVFCYVRNLLSATSTQPHVLTAKAKGLSAAQVLMRHVLPPAAPQIFALAGVSVSIALGAAIPIEVICDVPGIGQLAWQAALGRDLPLLVNLTVLVTVVTLAANALSDFAVTASTPA